uniref:Uncharacterized protein n=1 Tax=Rhizophora mucronata TaxID=61149 RepID=A0A2P2NUB9_RHIMU
MLVLLVILSLQLLSYPYMHHSCSSWLWIRSDGL